MTKAFQVIDSSKDFFKVNFQISDVPQILVGVTITCNNLKFMKN